MTSCEVVVEGEFVSEATMEEWGWSEPIDWIMYYPYLSIFILYLFKSFTLSLPLCNWYETSTEIGFYQSSCFSKYRALWIYSCNLLNEAKDRCSEETLPHQPEETSQAPHKFLGSLDRLNIDSTCPVKSQLGATEGGIRIKRSCFTMLRRQWKVRTRLLFWFYEIDRRDQTLSRTLWHIKFYVQEWLIFTTCWQENLSTVNTADLLLIYEQGLFHLAYSQCSGKLLGLKWPNVLGSMRGGLEAWILMVATCKVAMRLQARYSLDDNASRGFNFFIPMVSSMC